MAAAAAFVMALSLSGAQEARFKPTKPVRIIVGYTPGGSTDVIARQAGAALGKLWGQTVIIENRPGAGGNIGADAVAKAEPDGHTLLMWHDGLAANASLYKNLPFDPVKDLTPVSTIARVSIVMGVATSSPAKSVQDVIAMAKSKPGQLSYASCGHGTPHHIAGEMFKSYTMVDMVHVSYKGCSPALNDIIGQHIPVFFQTLSNVTDHIRTGKVRVLAVADPARAPDFPEIPTMIEAGVPGYTLDPWYGIFAPGTTPKEIVESIAADIANVVKGSELNELLRKTQYRPEVTSPDEFRKLYHADLKRLGDVIREAKMIAE
jgi:tripartite-type tricarboxylate transporter receptor subunit TctC